ncbi:MAG: hypothetical protein HF312_15380 [Ignavibacteria bacterium]|jgi:hypothetical protein|nr:hypothetical protein [Ignavibacteria bacterium]
MANSLSMIWDNLYGIIKDDAVFANTAVSQDVFDSIPEEVDAAEASFPRVSVFYLQGTKIQEVRPAVASNGDREWTTIFVSVVAKDDTGPVASAKSCLDLVDVIKAIVKSNRGLLYKGTPAAETVRVDSVSFKTRKDLSEQSWYSLAAIRIEVVNRRD